MIIRGEVWEVWIYFGFLLYVYERGWSLKALSCLFVHLVYLAKPHLDLLFVHINNNSIIMSKVSPPHTQAQLNIAPILSRLSISSPF